MLQMLVVELCATASWQSEEMNTVIHAVCATLLAAAQQINNPPELRWRCINALAALNIPEAWLGLSRLVGDTSQPEDTRVWATHAHVVGLCFKTT